jgi:hypothetical protein
MLTKFTEAKGFREGFIKEAYYKYWINAYKIH